MCCVPRRLRHQRSNRQALRCCVCRPCVRDCPNTTQIHTQPEPTQLNKRRRAGLGRQTPSQPASHQGDEGETANPNPAANPETGPPPSTARTATQHSAAPPSASAPSPRTAAGHAKPKTPRDRGKLTDDESVCARAPLSQPRSQVCHKSRWQTQAHPNTARKSPRTPRIPTRRHDGIQGKEGYVSTDSSPKKSTQLKIRK